MSPYIVYIGLGSNSGDRWENLSRSLGCLESIPEVELSEVSSVYESEPVGLGQQPDFLNAVCSIRTALPPAQLLVLLQGIESRMGRERLLRKGPRTMDLDILLYGDLVIDEKTLKVPHPELHKRRFVLTPLVEISPSLTHPVLRKSLVQLLQEVSDSSRVELIGKLGVGLAVGMR